MKKKLLFIVINILLILVGLFAIELYIWNKENDSLKQRGVFPPNIEKLGFHKGIKKFNFDPKYFPTPENGYGRAPEGLNYKGKPLVIFGCSYAYGYQLEPTQTLSYKLAEKAKLPVYNRAFISWGIQHMLYQSKVEDLYATIPEPEYVMYVYINDHIRRLYLLSFSSWNILEEEFNLRYKDKNDELIEIKNQNEILNQIKRLYLTNKIQHLLVNKEMNNQKNKEKRYDFALKHFVEAKNEMQKHWNKTKFVVLFYNTTEDDEYLKNKLKENDFIVLDTKELTNADLATDEFLNQDKLHPNENAWELIAEKLIKELKL